MMDIYRGFAEVYARGSYPEYSMWIAGLFPRLLEQFNAAPTSLLDLACGEGTFAVLQAQRGIRVAGVDMSPELLRFAQERASQTGVEVSFFEQDMRSLRLDDSFDVVTCWYDSLNYILDYDELVTVFGNVAQVLNPGGLFIFDMNTIHGLAVEWQHQGPAYVQENSDRMFEVHRPRYDSARSIATLRITAFVREGTQWRRIDEEHRERGYPLMDIERALAEARLRRLACWGNPREMSPPQSDSGRIFVIAQRC